MKISIEWKIFISISITLSCVPILIIILYKYVHNRKLKQNRIIDHRSFCSIPEGFDRITSFTNDVETVTQLLDISEKKQQ